MKPVNPGDRLDHYSIETLVATGGMASVFRATDDRTGLPVAIKVPHPEMECDPVFFDRFRREAAIGRELDHPCILKVLPAIPGNRVYMAAEWVEGPTLRRILEENRKIEPKRSIRIAISVCEALAYLSEHNIAHRDLKPENIVVFGDDSIRLIDFGLASKPGSRLTFGKLSKIMGSPDYIAPEQLKGKRGGPSSDIYALGVILCEMVTGKVPFEGVNPFVAMNRRLIVEPALEGAPPELRAILRCALDRDPARRYSAANDFAADLRNPDESRNALLAAERPVPKKAVLFSLAVVPAAIFLMLLYVAQHQ